MAGRECLIGAAYTRKVQEAGLAGEPQPAMGRVGARFADWRIGVASEWAQRWVDRNFALDYMLKSLEKILDGSSRRAVRGARVVLKDASYTVLGGMIADKHARFRALFDQVQPEYLAVRYNALTPPPPEGEQDIFAFAAERGASVLINKPLGQGLLTGKYAHGTAPTFAPGDHRLRTVLASRSAALEPVPSGVTVLPHRAPCAAVHIGDHRLTLLGLYVLSRGPRERRNEDKRAFQEAVSAALPGLVARCDGPLIVAGDLNILEPGHTPHYRVFGQWEYDFYRSFGAVGLTDAFRHLHPEVAEHSWFGRGGNGYRFDHAFLTADRRGRLLTCGYLHEPRELGLTDHSALCLTMSFGGPAT